MPDHRERQSRPAANRAAKMSCDGDSTSLRRPADPIADLDARAEANYRRRWTKALMDAGRPWPRFGSEEWANLPEGDPRKVAACAAAAELYARQGDDLEADLRRQVEGSRRAHKAAEDAEYRERAAAHRAQWRHLDGWVHPANRRKLEALVARWERLRAKGEPCGPRPTMADVLRAEHTPQQPPVLRCPTCQTVTSPWTCSCGATRSTEAGDAA